jgi:hypothetical protein
MPEYTYISPSGETKNVIQRMTEPHIFFENGVEWKRVFVNPTASVDTKIDPFSSRDFAEKTGKKKGTMGNLFDASREASEKREKVMGKDPVKEKFLKDYSDKRGGKAHPSTWKKDITIEL